MKEIYDFKPQKNNISFHDLYGDGSIFIIGNDYNDRYIKVDRNSVENYRSILSLCNNEYSVKDIAYKLNISKEVVFKVISQIARIGGIVGIDANQQITESKGLIFEVYSLKPKNRLDIKKNIVYIMSFLCISIILVSFLFFINDFVNEKVIFNVKNIFDIKKPILSFGGVMLSCLIMIPSFLIHEMFHVFMAKAYKLPIDKVSFGLYLGIFPIFYVKIKNIYTISRYKRLIILISGIIGNIFIISVSYILYRLYGYNILKIIIVSQFNIILINLNPLALTDGYFLLCNILKKENIRIRVIGKISNSKFNALTKLELLYLTFNIFYVALNLYYVYIILNLSAYKISIFLMMFFALLYIFVLFAIIKIRFKK